MKTLQRTEILAVHDLSQNYICKYKDEAQGAGWENCQKTLHLSVTFYKIDETDCNALITHETVHTHSDIKHDIQAVRVFQVEMVNTVEWETSMRVKAIVFIH